MVLGSSRGFTAVRIQHKVISNLNRTRCFSSTTKRLSATMRFVQYKCNGRVGVGIQLTGEGGTLVDLTKADPSFPDNMCELLRKGSDILNKARSVVSSGTGPFLKEGEYHLLAPVTGPDKVLCVGMNYFDHCAEIGVPPPTEPVIFNKFPSTIIGPGQDIQYPDITQQLDWEVELTVVIGKTGRNIAKENAMSHIFGYTVAHDVTARDWQNKNGGQFLLGKSIDTFCPLGPAIVTTDDIPDPHNLGLRTRVNGVTKQDSSTSKLVFNIDTLISHISRFVTLLPGDIILTGTPPGVGCFRKPPEFLQKGDTVECEIDGIGTLANRVV